MEGWKEIKIRLTDKEYHQYVKIGQSMRIKKAIEDVEYVKWMFMKSERLGTKKG